MWIELKGTKSQQNTKMRRASERRHNGHNGVSNHQPHHFSLNRLFRRRSKKTSKLRVTGLCEGNSPVTGEFPAQMASNAENVSIGWRHHGMHSFVDSWHMIDTAFIWPNGSILLIEPLGTDLDEVWIQIQQFSFKKTTLEMSSENGGHFVSWQCVNLLVWGTPSCK